jgi:hypothetical protein
MLGDDIKTKCLRRLGMVGSPRTGSGSGYVRHGHDYVGDCGGNKGGWMAESVENVAEGGKNNNNAGVVCRCRCRCVIGILMDVHPGLSIKKGVTIPIKWRNLMKGTNEEN